MLFCFYIHIILIMLNLRAVEWFVTVVDAGGFTRAARRLGAAQPAVSATIKKLEVELGVTLLLRSARGITLTEEGDRFLEHARAILDHASAAGRGLKARRTLELGQLTLGAPPMVAGYLLPKLLDRFLAAHPGVRVTVVQAGADEIAARVARDVLDLGLIADWRRREGLAIRLLERHPVVACMARSNPLAEQSRITWAELMTQPLIAFPRGYYQRALLDEAARRVRAIPNIVVEAESVALIAELVRRGRGVATLLSATAATLQGVRSVAMPKDAEVPIALCRNAAVQGSFAARRFEEQLFT